MILRTQIEKLDVAKKALLDLANNGMLDNNSTAIQSITMEEKLLKRTFVLERHNGEIKQKSRMKNNKKISYWWAEVPKKDGNGYQQITANSEERLFEKLFDYYDNNVVKIESLEDAYTLWHQQREVDAKVYKTISGRTWDDDEDTWKRFWQDSKLAKAKIKSITVRDILNECKAITGAGNITYKAYNRAMNVLNQIYDMLLDEGVVDMNVARQVPKNRLKFKAETNHDGEYYAKEDRAKLLQYLFDLEVKTVYSLGVSLAACICKRLGEVRALIWEDYDAKNRTLTIRHQMATDYESMESTGKTEMDKNHLKAYRKPQIIPLSDYAIEVLEELRKINGNKKYILNSKGEKPIASNHFNAHLKQYCEACGVKYYPNHKFRFYATSEMYEQGVDETEISSYLNHSNIKMTRGYDRRINKNAISRETSESVLGFTPKRSQLVTT